MCFFPPLWSTAYGYILSGSLLCCESVIFRAPSFEILFWLKPHFNRINYKYQKQEWDESEGEQQVLQMTPNVLLPPQRQLIPSLTYQGDKKGNPSYSTHATDEDLGLVFHLSSLLQCTFKHMHLLSRVQVKCLGLGASPAIPVSFLLVLIVDL